MHSLFKGTLIIGVQLYVDHRTTQVFSYGNSTTTRCFSSASFSFKVKEKNDCQETRSLIVTWTDLEYHICSDWKSEGHKIFMSLSRH